MRKEKLKPHFGHGVCREEFWPRPYLVNQILRGVKNRESMSLLGPRRIGKSSLLLECARILRKEDKHTVIAINGEGMNAISKLFRNIIFAFPKRSQALFWGRVETLHFPKRLKQLLTFWKNNQIMTDQEEVELSRNCAALAEMTADLIPTVEKPPVLFLDELTYLCIDLSEQADASRNAKHLLAMFKDWQKAGLSMVVASSMSIRHFLREHSNIPRILLTGMNPINIPVLAEEDAKGFLDALASYEQLDWWNESIREIIIKQSVDLLPAALQLVFKHTVSLYEDGILDESLNSMALEEVLRKGIQDDFDNEFFSQFKDRFQRYEWREQKATKTILHCIAKSKQNPKYRRFQDIEEAVSKKLDTDAMAELDLDNLIDILKEDGFLFDLGEKDQIGFASYLVESWWKTRDHRSGRRRLTA